MIKQYNSFEEIDTHLKILSLQRKIDKESLKFNLERSMTDLKCSNVFGGFNSFMQQKMITWLIKRLVKLFRKD